jgi:hypothetical protein
VNILPELDVFDLYRRAMFGQRVLVLPLFREVFLGLAPVKGKLYNNPKIEITEVSMKRQLAVFTCLVAVVLVFSAFDWGKESSSPRKNPATDGQAVAPGSQGEALAKFFGSGTQEEKQARAEALGRLSQSLARARGGVSPAREVTPVPARAARARTAAAGVTAVKDTVSAGTRYSGAEAVSTYQTQPAEPEVPEVPEKKQWGFWGR